MDDLRLRYLRQQVEMGGSEVIFPPDARDAVVRRIGEREVATPTSEDGEELKPAGWMAGAPAIPGPGREVNSPLGLDPRQGLASLGTLAAEVLTCDRCALHRTRTQGVPGEGASQARLMLVGEGPGATEDETGRPFVGRAGELLTDILKAIGLRRDEVFIANVVKCRPPNNRKPLPDEVIACLPFLHRQIALIQPKVLLALGGTAAEALLQEKGSLGKLRGLVHRLNGIPLIVTYHPAALLRNPHWKKPTWDDVRIARQLLDR